MTLIEDFLAEMAQSVSIAAWASNDGYSDTYGTAATKSCSVKHKIKNVTKSDGTVAVSTLQIYLDGAVTVAARDKVVFGGNTIKILAVGTVYDAVTPSTVYATVIYS